MKRSSRLFRLFGGPTAANGLSLSIIALTAFFLHLESAPTPAGADIARRTVNRQAFVLAPAAAPAATGEKSTVVVADASNEALTPEQMHESALNKKLELIEKGLQFLSKAPGYTGIFVKQELVNGELLDEQEMELKLRHAPYSIYLKWTVGEVGREVLYVHGQNDGRIAAHGGGWKARLPTVALDPTGTLAMAESRYPVTKAGLLELAKTMIEVHKGDLEKKNFSRCEQLPDQMFDNRPCHAFMIEYKDASLSATYRKSIALIDKEWSIPVYTRNFGWLNGEKPATEEEHDTATLLEYYSYASLKFDSPLVAMDFDHDNEEYRFKRQ